MASAIEAFKEASAARPRLVFFCSRRDGHCRRVEGFIAQVLQRRRNHETFVLHAVDVEERADLAERFVFSKFRP